MDEYLREALRARRWTIPQFAEACDVSTGVAQKWVTPNSRNRSNPGPASCEKIAAALGVDVDYVLELAGHRKPRQPTPDVGALRQAVRDQLDRWLTAVGPAYESYFWRNLKAHGDLAAAFIQEVMQEPKTAINEGSKAAVSSVVSKPTARTRRRRRGPGGPLTRTYQHLERRVGRGRRRTDRPLTLPGRVTAPIWAGRERRLVGEAG